jgi:VWFA-related protein
MKLAVALALLALADPRSAIRNPQSAIRDPPSGRPERADGREPHTHTVTIDAIVSDARGRRLETLKAADFELREDGALRSIDEVRFVKDDARLFAMYLDEYHVAPGAASDRMRRALTSFLDQSVGPNDRVIVLKPLDSLLRIEPTPDLDAARRVVAAFEGRKGDYAPHTESERELFAGAPARIDAARAQVAWSAVDALAVHLGTHRDRRKTLIIASEPFAQPPRRRGQELLPSIESAVRAANRANVSVYVVDPADDPLPQGSEAEPLHRLAADTNGGVISGDLDAGLHRVDADARGYYLLTYRVEHPDDGRFHDVQVRVKRASTGEIRARKGFYDASPDEAVNAAILARLNAPKPDVPPEPPTHQSPLIRPWFGWSRGDAGRTRVTFVWEPAAPVPGERVRHVPTKLVFTALSPGGDVLFESAVAPTGAGTIQEPGVTPSRVSFDVAPGRVKLRMAIQDAAGQPLDRDVRDIVVRGLVGAVAIGTPEVMRARNARELRTLEAEAAVPVVSREFSRAEELLVRVPVYTTDDSAPQVSARLLGRSGQSMRELEPGPARQGAFDAFVLPLAGLAVGEYTIEVTAKGAGGEAKDRLVFRVGS